MLAVAACRDLIRDHRQRCRSQGLRFQLLSPACHLRAEWPPFVHSRLRLPQQHQGVGPRRLHRLVLAARLAGPRSPGIEVVALEASDEEIEAWLAAGTVDVAVVMDPGPDGADAPLGRDECTLGRWLRMRAST